MLETREEIGRLQAVLDRSAAGAGPHLSAIITDDRRLSATRLCATLRGMRLLVVATVTADGRPISGPVDGYFLHGSFWFSSGREAVRMRHLAVRPAITACHVPSDALAVTMHGRAQVFGRDAPAWRELRQAMLDHYLPLQGQAFQDWLDRDEDVMGARIIPDKIFTFSTSN